MMESWFRFYSEAAKDVKLKRVARASNAAFGDVLGVWALILCIASESPERGTLLLGTDLPVTPDDINGEYGRDVTPIINALIATGVLGQDGDLLYIVHWNKRQYISDTSAERTASYRARRKIQADSEPLFPAESIGDDNVTMQKRQENVTVTPPDTDTETDNPEAKASGRKTIKKPGRPAKPRDPLLDHPAVMTYRSTAKLTPNEDKRQAMSIVTDLERWQAVLHEWSMHGWRMGNVQGQLEMYGERTRASPSSNGHERPDPPAQQRLRALRAQEESEVHEA